MSNYLVNDFAERLRCVRAKRGLSQAALAKASGVSQSAIASYESRARLGSKSIIDIAQALKVDPVWLATGKIAANTTLNMQTPALVSDVSTTSYLPYNHKWPFSKILPQQYWNLTSEQRSLLEETLLTMISHFNNS